MKYKFHVEKQTVDIEIGNSATFHSPTEIKIDQNKLIPLKDRVRQQGLEKRPLGTGTTAAGPRYGSENEQLYVAHSQPVLLGHFPLRDGEEAREPRLGSK